MAIPARSRPELPPAPVGSPSPIPGDGGPQQERAAAEALVTRPMPVRLPEFALQPARPAALRLVEVPAASEKPALLGRKKESSVLRGLKDMQQLQKQTIAVLEAIRGGLEEIQQVLRSPEATRGLEKQQNAAMLLAKGFAREAVEQAEGAAMLLPANPETHLLLALSLAGDQQFEASLTAARKGLALFDRRAHPLAIEAGLLHALAALGCGPEAVERWTTIIEGLPLPILLEHMGRIAACFPTDAPEGQLDEMLNRRLVRDGEGREADPSIGAPPRPGAAGPAEETAATLFAALDAAKQGRLMRTHRALLAHVARRLVGLKAPADLLRFLTECVVPLANRELDKSARALGRAATKRLLVGRADAMSLFRAMQKLQMAGLDDTTAELGNLLRHWRQAGNRVARARRLLGVGVVLLVGGGVWYGVMSSRATPWVGPIVMLAGACLGLYGLMSRTTQLTLPYGRPALTSEELAYLNTPEVRQTLRGAVRGRA